MCKSITSHLTGHEKTVPVNSALGWTERNYVIKGTIRFNSIEESKIQKEIEKAHRFNSDGNYDAAAESFRKAANLLLRERLFSFSINYYSNAAGLFEKCGKYLKSISCITRIYNIHQLNANYNGQAVACEKIASIYKYYLKDFLKAGKYYKLSAGYHEDNENISAAYKKAKFAYECFLETNRRSLFFDCIGHATRLALKAGYTEKAAESALLWYKHAEKKFDGHHLSIVMKGYKSFSKIGKYKEAYELIQDILIAHYEKNKHQNNILTFLTDAQEFYVRIYNAFNFDLDNKILKVYKENYLDISNYYLALKNLSSSLGLRELADYFFAKENYYKKNDAFKRRKIVKFLVYQTWETTCNYGTSAKRWLLFSLILILIFGAIYSSFPCPSYVPTTISNALSLLSPSINIVSVNNWYTPFYFSIVTFTTLGFGDVTPLNLAAQLWISLEVIIGYIMLGGLITIFTRKLVR